MGAQGVHRGCTGGAWGVHGGAWEVARGVDGACMGQREARHMSKPHTLLAGHQVDPTFAREDYSAGKDESSPKTLRVTQ